MPSDPNHVRARQEKVEKPLSGAPQKPSSGLGHKSLTHEPLGNIMTKCSGRRSGIT